MKHAKTTIFILLLGAQLLFSPLLAESQERLFLEAEGAELHGKMVSVSDDAASNGAYVWTPPLGGTSSVFFDYAVFRFYVTTAGIYAISGGVYAESETSDSFFIKVNTIKPFAWFIRRNVIYDKNYANDRALQTLQFKLAAGENSVKIFAREAGARLDWLQLELIQKIN